MDKWLSHLFTLSPLHLFIFSLILLLAGSSQVVGQQLALRHYNVGDGLAHSKVTAILQDRKGYIWFGTFEGLSRFDGYRFINYSIQDGLAHLLINDLNEDQHGHLWVATNGGGVARLIDTPQGNGTSPAPQQTKFVSYKVGESEAANNVNELIFDTDNRLWCLTDDGIYRALVTDALAAPKFERLIPSVPFLPRTTFVDRRGRLWFAIGRELTQIIDDSVNKYGAADALGGYDIVGLAEDNQGRLYLANSRELFAFTEPAAGAKGRWQRLPLALASGEDIRSLIADAETGLWFGTAKGLIRYRDGQQTV